MMIAQAGIMCKAPRVLLSTVYMSMLKTSMQVNNNIWSWSKVVTTRNGTTGALVLVIIYLPGLANHFGVTDYFLTHSD